ncbi:MAG TPA: CotH kinase family protein, partial [Candidatus Eisenbacteria bacterium]|nr:CotH kinase family protein [Candidatus Eisenbacteria bacterium]
LNDITPEQKAWLQRYVSQFERALYGSNFANPETGYARYLDVDSFIDQHWLIELSKNIDGYRYSAFIQKDRGGKLKMEPVWDWNLSFGNADYHGGWQTDSWYWPLIRNNEICWYRRLSQDPEFMQRVIDRWGELRKNQFAPATILGRIDEMAAQLNEAQVRNFQRWPILGQHVHPNSYVGETFADEVNWMKQWIQKRIAWIDSQMLRPPALSLKEGQIASGTSLAIRAPAGKIYYTLDGTDPRLPGGEVSAKAQPYDAAIALKGSVKIFARVNQNNSWSSPAKATFTVKR